MRAKRASSCKILQKIIDVLFFASGDLFDLSTCQIAEFTGLDVGLVGATLARSPWVARRRRVRINRNTVRTVWGISDAAMIEYARRHASTAVRQRSLMASRGVTVNLDHSGRVNLRCGSVTAIVHIN